MGTPEQKRLWREYNELQNWLSQNNVAKIEEFSFEQRVLPPSQEKLSDTASSSTNVPHATCTMIIYPSTSIFMQRGLEVEMLVPYTFPHEPPSFIMKSEVRHPNIHKNGKICIGKLESTKTWEPIPLKDVLMSVIKLIEEPKLDYVVDAETASLYNTNKQAYEQQMQTAMTQHGKERI